MIFVAGESVVALQNAITTSHSLGQAVKAMSGAIQNMSEALKATQSLTQSVLNRRPVNVYKLQEDS